MTEITTDDAMKSYGQRLGKRLRGGEIIELIGDVGAGKTTLVKGIGAGLQVDDDVQSPSFTISRQYSGRDGLQLHHYDFYRLADPGIMRFELAESLGVSGVVTVIEWAAVVGDVLPDERIRIELRYTPTGEGRQLFVTAPEMFDYLELV